MNPEISRQKTLALREKINKTHMHCRMEVRQKGPHIGLYCSEHGVWIKWISQKEADRIKDIL